MNIHDRRSLELHRAAADKLRANPAWLERARQRVGSWLAQPQPPYYAKLWRDILARPVPQILVFLVEESELAQELRAASPFAGILTPQERWAVLKRFVE
jgi:hypothetical protein